jgi:DNA processing protein
VLRSNFARRNRIVSGLSLGTLVIEAALGSGALITAALARRQGRKVLAVPGSIGNPLARGCHQLIRGGARLVESPSQVLEELEISFQEEGLAAHAQASPAAPPLDKGYEMLLDALGFEPASIDILTARTGWPAERLASMLLILELEGRVAPHPGGRYGRIPVDDDRQRSRHSDLRV